MKTMELNTNNLTRIALGFFFVLLLISNSNIQAQGIQVKGIVKAKFDETIETLSDVNVYLKGTNVGTTTDRKGEFTFPRKLKKGDILVFSYLGYKKKKVILKNTSTYLTVVLEEDDNVLLGATNTHKRYRSKKHND